MREACGAETDSEAAAAAASAIAIGAGAGAADEAIAEGAAAFCGATLVLACVD